MADDALAVLFPLGGPASAIRSKWQRYSAEAYWAHPADWWDPAVDALAEAVADGRDATVPAELLGAVRAEAGVGLPEALDDLAALYTVVSQSVPPFEVVRSFTGGWADAGVNPVRTSSCQDAMTGLATSSYLRTRLAEVYRSAVADNVLVTDTMGIVILDASVMTTDPWQRLARVCVLADCLREMFAGGESLVALGSGRVAALVPRGEDLNPMLTRLKDLVDVRLVVGGLSRASRRPPRVWLEPLPADYDQALALLRELER
jgi:hypothetical protein